MHCNWRSNGSSVKATMTRVHDLDMPRPISPVDYRILPPAFAFAFLCAFRFCFLKYSFDITSLFQSLPSSLLSLKVSQSPQRHTKNPNPAHFYPHCFPAQNSMQPAMYLPAPPVQGVLITKHAHSKECQANLWWWERRHPQKKLRCL